MSDPEPRPVRSFDALMARMAEAAVAISGADHSSWNGGFKPPPTNEAFGVDGIAWWSHEIGFHDKFVLEPLREMFEHAGEQQPPETLARYWNAISTVLHENSHLLAGPGTDHGDGHKAFAVPAGAALEEGATEAYAFANTDRYIRYLGLDTIAPGITDVQGNQSYPQYVPAVQVLTTRIGEVSGLGGPEVLRRLNVVNAAQKWAVATATLYSAAKLDQVVPAAEAGKAASRIQRAMLAEFAKLSTLPQLTTKEREKLTPEQIVAVATAKRAAAADLGEATFTAGQAVVRQLRIETEVGRAIAAAATGQAPPASVNATASAEPGRFKVSRAVERGDELRR